VQATLKSAVRIIGTGLHLGQPARMTLHPAAADTGIRFRRSDVTDRDNIIPARFDRVLNATLCTELTNAAGVKVSTVEHVMAALAGCGIGNVLIEIDGPEVPILDGSAARFVQAFLAAGIRPLEAPVRALRVLKRVEVRRGAALASLEPAATLEIDFEIDFPEPAIGRQAKALRLANGSFVRELCDSRTFCRQQDVDDMRGRGLALGGTMENALVIDGARVLNPGGFRHRDECVRHKMLDALGDLALAGAPILGRYRGLRAGHALTNDLLRALFADREAWAMVTCTPAMAARLPGAGLGQGDLAALAAVAA
jgi:UDP-3-O-[3-hydroxymyristoyl] N-acetylglucosamine deacetylase